MKQALTHRQEQVYLFIERKARLERRPPTIREIGAEMGISSPNGVVCHLDALEKKGWIERLGHGRSCGIRLPAADVGQVSDDGPLGEAVGILRMVRDRIVSMRPFTEAERERIVRFLGQHEITEGME